MFYRLFPFQCLTIIAKPHLGRRQKGVRMNRRSLIGPSGYLLSASIRSFSASISGACSQLPVSRSFKATSPSAVTSVAFSSSRPDLQAVSALEKVSSPSASASFCVQE